MLSVRLYHEDMKDAWNEFILHSKNGTFMLGRDYLEYHSDRFDDFSLMFYQENNLIAVMPASKHGDEIRSHGGLTYGGIVCGLDMSNVLMLECFQALCSFCTGQGFKKLLYKRVPYIYYSYPADEDLYALFINKARLVRRDISSCILQGGPLGYSEKRLRNLRSQSIRRGLEIRENLDYETFINMLAEVLAARHQVKPTHTAEELSRLSRHHPDNIKLYSVFLEDKMLSGAVVYETPLVVHTQYMANSEDGRKLSALDFLIDYLVNDRYREKTFFDFGISTENGGLSLNEGLDFQKSKFGGRGVVHDFYELNF